MNYQTLSFLGCLLGALFAPAALADQVILTPDMDATLYEDDSGALANGIGENLFFGRVGGPGGEKLRRALIRFDLSAIPSNARIDAVSLSLEINKSPGTGAEGGLATLHRVTSSWSEGPTDAAGNEGTGSPSVNGDVTWLHRVYPSSSWAQPGGDFQAGTSGSAGYGVGEEFLDFTTSEGLKQDVTFWVRNPSQNFGWMLLGNEGGPALTARRIYARESVGQNVPTLTVDYTVPLPTDYLSLTPVATSLSRPVAVVNANDGSGRLFIVEQQGRIKVFDTTTQTVSPTVYLDISSLITGGGLFSEQGLLGLAFHPEFASNRQFYVYYIRDPGAGQDRSVLAMYQQDINNSDIANPSATVLMEFAQEQANHNGGDLHFGDDGFLYIASGDGGGGGDPFGNAQNPDTLKGKILRIDVDGTPPPGGELCGNPQLYGIPPGNAFPGSDDGCDEILHLGLRNPWKFSFDAKTGEMYIGDVGQGDWEEVDRVPVGASGLNFGWPCFEGTHVYDNGASCPGPVSPIVEYSSASGGNCSITGGYVYRGGNTALQGYYVYADYCSDRVWMVRSQNGGWAPMEWTSAAAILNSPTAFGQDEQCELYVAEVGDGGAGEGTLYRFDSSEVLLNSGFESLRCQ